MAHAARLQGLIGELVDSIVAHYTLHDHARFVIKASADAALANLRHHRFARTNQFSVRKSLDGLVEKFQLLNNDPLADALDSALTRLARVENNWTPDLLALCLFLSDNPAAKTNVHLLQELRPPTTPPPLTWKDIIADDPSPEDQLCFPSDSASDVSQDDATLQSQTLSNVTKPQHLSFAPAEPDASSHVESLVVVVDTSILDDLANARSSPALPALDAKTRLTELQAVREVLFMLHGLPSSLFDIDKKTADLAPVHTCSIHHLSRSTFGDLLAAFASIGSDLAVLRKNISSRHAHPLLHILTAAVEQQVKDVDNKLTEMQTIFAKGDGRIVVSLLNVLVRVRAHTRHVPILKDIVIHANELEEGYAHHVLDRLYDHTCELQGTGDDISFGILVAVFFECINVFLRPIHQWMVNGELQSDLELISTSTAAANVDPGMFWECRFSLRVQDGHPAAPHFIVHLISLIFASGKSVAFLKELGVENQPADRLPANDMLTMDLSSEADEASGLLPFSVLLDQKLRNWVSSRHRLTSRGLCTHLTHRFGVLRSINALEYLYLSKDGAVFEAFANSVFRRLDTGLTGWNDTYAVETIAQHVFGAIECIDTASISVTKVEARSDSQERLMLTLSSFALDYSYSWPIQNIIPFTSLRAYQQIFSFLTLIHRASSLLSLHRFRAPNSPRTDIKSHSTPNIATTTEAQQQARTLAQHLHHRLMQLVCTLQGYITQTAIQLSCEAFHKVLAEAQDVDGMVAAHASLIKSLARRCMMVQEVDTVRNALIRLLELTYAFADLVAGLNGGGDAHPNGRQPRAGSQQRETLDSDLDSEGEGEEAPTAETRSPWDPRHVVDIRAQRALNLEPKALLTRLRQMKMQYMNLLSIAVASLRSARREEGGEEAWEELAERLEWNLGR